MKNFVFSLIMLFVSFVGFGQVIEVEFSSHIAFNSGSHLSYDDMIKDENMVIKEFKYGGTNKYVIDLDNKQIKLFYNNILVETETIIDYKIKNGLVFISLNDVELLTNKNVVSYIVVNQNEKDKIHPKFTFYFISTVDNTSNGYLSL